MTDTILKILVLMFTKIVFCKSDIDVQKIATAVNEFGDDLYQIQARSSGNIVFAPFGLHSMLALLSIGAAGKTRKELLSQLHLPNIDILRRGYPTILDEYFKQNPKISTALFTSQHYSLLNTFKAIAIRYFHAHIQQLNFEKRRESAAIVNEWAANETKHMLSAGVDADSFNHQTAILLLNTIYFKGQWKLKFDKSKTNNKFVFHTPNGKVDCSMMTMKTTRHDVVITPDFIYLELSFYDTNLKIAFVIPSDSNNLANLEQRFDSKTLFAQRNNLHLILLTLKVPKFKLGANYDYKYHLMSIGLLDMLTDPDFSHMLRTSAPVEVTDINQNTVVEINEHGATAATITKIMLGKTFILLTTLMAFLHCANSQNYIARAVNKFGDELYKYMAKEDGNIIFSPFSVHSVLSLLALGSKGTTQKELLSKLRAKNLYNLKTLYKSELKRHKAIDKNVRIANTLFYDDSLTISKSFIKIAKRFFGAEPQKTAFKETVKAADVINQWVADQTKQGITSMVNEQSLSSDTLLMLINAIYFKAKWNVTFSHSDTVKDYVFHSPKGDVNCDMMVMKQHKHKYFRKDDFHILEVSFSDSAVKIAFISPKYESKNNESIASKLHRLEQNLNDNRFFKAMKNLKVRMIDIYIPKFKITGDMSLKKYLTQIGITMIFDTPNLSNIFVHSKQLNVKDIDQKTIVDINEDGVMAAAATTARFVTRSGYRPKFILDAPFLFVIYDSKNQVILIKGRVENPKM